VLGRGQAVKATGFDPVFFQTDDSRYFFFINALKPVTIFLVAF
jgi:hypothetical protein